MKVKKLILMLIALSVALVCAVLTACGTIPSRPDSDGSETPSQSEQEQPSDGETEQLPAHVQQLNYAESVAKIDNPDQGFYRPIYVDVKEDGVTRNRNVEDATRLYHLRVDISAFSSAVNGSEDKELTETALAGLDDLLAYLKANDKNAVVRFVYDPWLNGNKDKEPALDTMLRHIEQVCPVLNKYESTVTAIEAGLIGPWGEMHSSVIAKPENISQIAGAYLAQTESIPVLVRTPKMIYDYLGITVKEIDEYKIAATDKAYRLGLFNDGYLGSANDLGTYTDRAREVEFLSGQTAHLPYGGEVVVPTSTLHDIDACLPEMYKLDLSYLNVEWNNQVIDKWKNSKYTKACGDDKHYYGKSAFEYIENRLGYRLALTQSIFEQAAGKLDIKLTVNNVGFGNLNKSKRAKLIFTDESGEVAFTHSAADFTGGDYEYSLELDLPVGEYEAYLCAYGDEENGAPLYAVRFANDGLWNDELKANKIGKIKA